MRASALGYRLRPGSRSLGPIAIPTSMVGFYPNTPQPLNRYPPKTSPRGGLDSVCALTFPRAPPSLSCFIFHTLPRTGCSFERPPALISARVSEHYSAVVAAPGVTRWPCVRRKQTTRSRPSLHLPLHHYQRYLHSWPVSATTLLLYLFRSLQCLNRTLSLA